MKMQPGMGAQQVQRRKTDMEHVLAEQMAQGQGDPSAPATMEPQQIGTAQPMRPGMGAQQVSQTKADMESRMQGTPETQPAESQEPAFGAGIVMTDERIAEAETLLQKYKAGKSNLERRIVENEQWYKLRHWEQIGHSRNPGDPEPASAWLLNSLSNKHADAMDNYPEPSVLPREEADKPDAEILTSVLPTVLEQNQFEKTYNDMWWYKLKNGTGVMGVFWDSSKEGGLGDVDIRPLDILNLFWEPGIKDIQKSANLFNVDLMDVDRLVERYPQLEGVTGGPTLRVEDYLYDDTVDTSNKVAVVDWYYKTDAGDGKTLLHYCKFACGKVLYASEDDPDYAQRGYYDHGKYPVIFDVLFPEEGTPAGFGYLDVCKSPQMYIDKLDQVLLKHAVMASRPRFFVRGDGEINEQEFADWTKDFVHFTGSGNPGESVVPITVPALDAYYAEIKQSKIDELKETSGNRDFSQGGVTSGVTAASAIAALQEAGSKLSRDMIKSSYRAFSQACYMVIDLMRQFYSEPRMFRIVGKQGEMKFAQFSGQRLAEQQTGDGFSQGYRVPVFDIRVVAQKASPFSTVAQNERAKEFYQLGFFRPDLSDQALACLSMMQFEGIDSVRERIQQNGTMMQILQKLAPLSLQMAQELDMYKGTQYAPQVAQLLGQEMGSLSTTPGKSAGSGETDASKMGAALKQARSQTAGEARKRAATQTTK